MGNKREVSTRLSTFLPCGQDSENEHREATMVTEEHSEFVDLVEPEDSQGRLTALKVSPNALKVNSLLRWTRKVGR